MSRQVAAKLRGSLSDKKVKRWLCYYTAFRLAYKIYAHFHRFSSALALELDTNYS